MASTSSQRAAQARYRSKPENKLKIAARARRLRANYTEEEREKRRLSRRRWHLRRMYGITAGEFDQMVIDQRGCCAICKREVEDLAVDHCHRLGRPRGLLCHPCNRGLGQFADDIELLRAAIGYLERAESCLM